MNKKELKALKELLSDDYCIKWLTIKIEPRKKTTQKKKKSKSDNCKR